MEIARRVMLRNRKALGALANNAKPGNSSPLKPQNSSRKPPRAKSGKRTETV